MTNVTITHRNAGTSNLAMVTADQETILGNGTTGDPLRLASGVATGDPSAPLVFEMGSPLIGLFVSVSDDVPSIPGVDGVVVRADASAQATSQPIGIVVGGVTGSPLASLIQVSGIVDLSPTVWQALVAGGIAPGLPYYLSTTDPGRMTATPPTADDTYVAQVGVALSDRKLLLSTLQYEPTFNQGT